MNRAIFFDRDGTLLVEMGYLSHPSLVRPYAFAAEALSLARQAGFLAIVVTNQSGIARGFLKEEDLEAVHERMHSLLAAAGAGVDAVYYCPHHPDGTVAAYSAACDCRKPGTGLGLRAVSRYGIDPARSYTVGDKAADFQFGRNLGTTPCLVRTGYGDTEAAKLAKLGLEKPLVFDNVLEAVKYIVGRDSEERS